MHDNIESHLIEERIFRPPSDFAKKARIKSLDQYRRMYRESIKQPEKFWAREARELTWQAPWKKVVEWKAPLAGVAAREYNVGLMLPRPALPDPARY